MDRQIATLDRQRPKSLGRGRRCPEYLLCAVVIAGFGGIGTACLIHAIRIGFDL
jgi:hypothetical protein